MKIWHQEGRNMKCDSTPFARLCFKMQLYNQVVLLRGMDVYEGELHHSRATDALSSSPSLSPFHFKMTRQR
jgi:hypothetical protein